MYFYSVCDKSISLYKCSGDLNSLVYLEKVFVLEPLLTAATCEIGGGTLQPRVKLCILHLK